MKHVLKSVLFAGLIAETAGAQDLHPAFDLANLRPGMGTASAWEPRGIGGMAFLPSGDLVVCTWGGSQKSIGELWRVSGVARATNPNIVTTVKLAGGFREPLGLRLIDGTLYMLQKNQITRVVDDTRTGKYNGTVTMQNVYDKWTYDDKNHHDFSFGFIYKDSAFYFNTGVYPPRANGPERGAVIKVDLRTRTHAPFSGGMRNANGMALGPEGQLFSTDNQGHWLPGNKLVNQRYGRQYGHNKGDNVFQSEPESPPVVWIGAGEVGNSPSEPLWLKSGPFAGQFLYGDIRFGGIKRIFVERVKGEYQGAVIPFIEPAALECGPNRLELGPDSAIYIGGAGGGVLDLGGSLNWQWNEKWTGLQKIKFNGRNPFEMKAVRSKANGFEIEFSKPAGPAAAEKATYRVDRWGVRPQAAYGAGAKELNRQVTVQSVTLSPDGKRALITLAEADLEHEPTLPLKSTVFRLTVRALKAADGTEPLLRNLAWYTMNAKGPADALGCMVASDPKYDASAVYDDGIQCAHGAATALAPSGRTLAGIAVGAQGVRFDLNGALALTLTDLGGRVVARTRLSGPGEYRYPAGLARGIYTLGIRTSNGAAAGYRIVR